MRLPAFAAALLLALNAAPSRAALIDQGGSVLDDVSGLEWLKPATSVGFSFEDVLSGNGNTLAADGWRHATEAEACGLAVQVGPSASTTTCPGLTFQDGGAFALDGLDLFGRTREFMSEIDPFEGTFSTADEWTAVFDDGDRSNGDGLFQLGYYYRSTSAGPRPESVLRVQRNLLPEDLRFPETVAHLLVREVPEPGTLPLILGIASAVGIGAHVRRSAGSRRAARV